MPTVIKKLSKPWKVGGKVATDIEVRPSTMADAMEAEKEASPYQQPNAFNIQMASMQLVRAGDFTGPFVASHFTSMRRDQFGEIASALQEADKLGEE